MLTFLGGAILAAIPYSSRGNGPPETARNERFSVDWLLKGPFCGKTLSLILAYSRSSNDLQNGKYQEKSARSGDVPQYEAPDRVSARTITLRELS